jgi:hypothetical protein
MGIKAYLCTIILIILAACKSPPTSSATPPKSEIEWDISATTAQRAKGTPYIQRYLDHWKTFPKAPIFHIIVVPQNSIPAPYRDPQQPGEIHLWFLSDGSIGGAEWEIPLTAQRIWLDPPSFTYQGATWGPLFPGQSADGIAYSLK